MDGGPWWAAVHGVVKGWTRLSYYFHFSLSCTGEGNGNPLQCSCLENPRDGEPGGLPSMGSHRVENDWSDLAAAAAELLTNQLLRCKCPGYSFWSWTVMCVCVCVCVCVWMATLSGPFLSSERALRYRHQTVKLSIWPSMHLVLNKNHLLYSLLSWIFLWP